MYSYVVMYPSLLHCTLYQAHLIDWLCTALTYSMYIPCTRLTWVGWLCIASLTRGIALELAIYVSMYLCTIYIPLCMLRTLLLLLMYLCISPMYSTSRRYAALHFSRWAAAYFQVISTSVAWGSTGVGWVGTRSANVSPGSRNVWRKKKQFNWLQYENLLRSHTRQHASY